MLTDTWLATIIGQDTSGQCVYCGRPRDRHLWTEFTQLINTSNDACGWGSLLRKDEAEAQESQSAGAEANLLDCDVG